MRSSVIFFVVFGAACVHAAESTKLDLSPIRTWIDQQSRVQSISAEMIQTRALRTLRDPVVSKGRVWIQRPSSFRWQLGEPPKIIVFGSGDALITVKPKRKTAIRKASFDAGLLPFRGELSFEEFQRQMDVLKVQMSGETCRVELLPKESRARSALSKLVLEFYPKSGILHAFEVVTREGSSLRTEFSNVRINEPIDPMNFRWSYEGYKVTDEP